MFNVKKQKAIGWVSPPPMAFRNLFSEALQAGPGTATAIIMGRSSGS
jgi:hypothetical protein